MKILVLNCGSSSVKYKLIELDDNAQNVLAEGGVEKVGLPDSFLKFKYNGEKVTITTSMPNHNVAIRIILDNLTSAKYGCIKDFGEIDAVGHRVVHGGEKFNSSVQGEGMLRLGSAPQPSQHRGHRGYQRDYARRATGGCV